MLSLVITISFVFAFQSDWHVCETVCYESQGHASTTAVRAHRHGHT